MKNLNFKAIATLIVILNILSNNAYSQDIHFSQYNMSPLTQNPAMAGAIYNLQANVNYKDQWREVGTPYKTFAMSADMRFSKKRVKTGFLAGGLTFINDNAGDAGVITNQATVNLAYHIKLDRHQNIGGGLQIGMLQRSIGNGALQWGNQFDGTNYTPTLPNGESLATSNFSALDVGFGAMWAYDNSDGNIHVTDNHDLNFNFGISAFHLNRPKYSFTGSDERLPIKFVAHGEGVISVTDTEWGFVPGLMFYSQGKTREFSTGLLLRYLISQESKYTGFKSGAALYVGAYIRAKDAIIPRIAIDYAGWSFGISYDINVSNLALASNSRGGLEFSLRLVTPNPFGSTGGARHSRY
jgi:type IX secretion system PorP/SprF family membrane protein